MFNAIQPEYHPQAILEDTVPDHQPLRPSRFVTRRIATALRWAEMRQKIGWAGVVLGDVLPTTLFDRDKYPDARWRELLLGLTPFSDQIAGDAMQLLEKEMRGPKPSKLLGDATPREFGEWIDGFILDENGAGNRSPLKSVVWVAKRVAERWAHDASTTFLFEKLLATDGSTIWPNAGLIATRMMDPFFWDACGLNSAPLCVAPLDQVIPTIVPGLRFATYFQQHCRKCQQDLKCSDTNTLCQVPAESPVQVQTALDGSEVIPPPDTCGANREGSRSPDHQSYQILLVLQIHPQPRTAHCHSWSTPKCHTCALYESK
jgi:hypothetical protein